MALILTTDYSKKLGLPGFSSHQFSVSIQTELTDLDRVPGEVARLYHLLQQAVDREIQQTGFVPADGYGETQRLSDLLLQHLPVLLQPSLRLRLLRIRDLSAHDVPESRRVVALKEVGQFVEYDVIDHEHWGLVFDAHPFNLPLREEVFEFDGESREHLKSNDSWLTLIVPELPFQRLSYQPDDVGQVIHLLEKDLRVPVAPTAHAGHVPAHFAGIVHLREVEIDRQQQPLCLRDDIDEICLCLEGDVELQDHLAHALVQRQYFGPEGVEEFA